MDTDKVKDSFALIVVFSVLVILSYWISLHFDECEYRVDVVVALHFLTIFMNFFFKSTVQACCQLINEPEDGDVDEEGILECSHMVFKLNFVLMVGFPILELWFWRVNQSAECPKYALRWWFTLPWVLFIVLLTLIHIAVPLFIHEAVPIYKVQDYFRVKQIVSTGRRLKQEYLSETMRTSEQIQSLIRAVDDCVSWSHHTLTWRALSTLHIIKLRTLVLRTQDMLHLEKSRCVRCNICNMKFKPKEGVFQEHPFMAAHASCAWKYSVEQERPPSSDRSKADPNEIRQQYQKVFGNSDTVLQMLTKILKEFTEEGKVSKPVLH